jgi:hypothetical protein
MEAAKDERGGGLYAVRHDESELTTKESPRGAWEGRRE